MMRGLPFSIVMHLAALGLLTAWGGQVRQPPLEPQRVLRVQIARLPAVVPPASAAIVEPAPTAIVTDPVPARPQPEPPPMPPKEVPRETKRPEPSRSNPEPAVQPTPPPAESPPAAAAEPGLVQPAGGPTVSGTDVDFPFAWYLNRVEGIIARQWNPRQLGFRESTSRTCVVHFLIDRSGQVAQVALVRSSGVSLFDREALRAVKAGRLPPLPAKFPHRALGVTFVFTLESGI
ncbi:MAG: TonB family protein [Candidatus Krumholzibacteria bacterium]|nr:TonB family protein [Candidatus Krumholzibacteria bacterium]